jgi:hypothetical protein
MKSKPAHTGSKKGGPFGGDWHVSHTSMGMGDYYGTGIKAKLGKVLEGAGSKPLTKNQMGTPPRSVC